MTETTSGRTPAGSPFWQFSLAFYRDGDVAAACLDLQDECQVDVNLLLFLLWLASTRRILPEAALRALDAQLSPWRSEVVRPLRAIRRRLKAGDELVGTGQAAGFRAGVKALELEAERLQQEAMHALAGDLAGAPAVAPEDAGRSNLAAYERVMNRPFNRASVERLLAALTKFRPST